MKKKKEKRKNRKTNEHDEDDTDLPTILRGHRYFFRVFVEHRFRLNSEFPAKLRAPCNSNRGGGGGGKRRYGEEKKGERERKKRKGEKVIPCLEGENGKIRPAQEEIYAASC